ncbi:hypothetical protein BD560DRAFT_397699 [Blakeslea trispora]|nr:hypothetical protein BD560DRAFT_397699 [Blakeslea trispora]
MTEAETDRPDLVEMGDALASIKVDPLLEEIAKTNLIHQTTWDNLKRIIKETLAEQRQLMADKLTDNTRQQVDALCLDIEHILQDQQDCPFTIQRICELVIHPTSYYRMYIKYLRAIQKVVSIRSTYEDYNYTPPEVITKEEESEEDEEEDALDDMFDDLPTKQVEEPRTDLSDFSKHKRAKPASDE